MGYVSEGFVIMVLVVELAKRGSDINGKTDPPCDNFIPWSYLWKPIQVSDSEDRLFSYGKIFKDLIFTFNTILEILLHYNFLLGGDILSKFQLLSSNHLVRRGLHT